jgi:hypothetical protein
VGCYAVNQVFLRGCLPQAGMRIGLDTKSGIVKHQVKYKFKTERVLNIVIIRTVVPIILINWGSEKSSEFFHDLQRDALLVGDSNLYLKHYI